jgi:hypothetical protein
MNEQTSSISLKDNNLSGPKVLLEGPTGTGKSFAIGTAVDWAEKNGQEVFILFTEQGGLESLLGYWRDVGVPPFKRREAAPIPDCLHWHVIRTPSLGLDALIDGAVRTGQLSYQALTNWTDGNRAKNNPWEAVLRALADFPCDRTGKKFGNVGQWTNKRILVNDSLSESANACFRMVLGSKTIASQNEYQVAQQNLLAWVRWMTQFLQCTFIMTAHIQRQVNDLTGVNAIMTKVLGRALADELPVLFSDVVLTVRETDRFYWDTAAVGVDLKTRNLPIQSKITPDFAQIMGRWAQRNAA